MKHCPNQDCQHLAETGRAGEFRDDIAQCSDCGTDLAPGEAPEVEPPGQIQWVAMMVVADPHSAHLAKTALAMEGIPSELRPIRRDGEGMVPGRPGAAELIVPEHMAEAAKNVLAERSAEPVPLPDDEDLEFLDADGAAMGVEFDAEEAQIEDQISPEDPQVSSVPNPSAAVSQAAAVPGDRGPACCPRCDSPTVTRATQPSPGESMGFWSKLFASRARWQCQACQHSW